MQLAELVVRDAKAWNRWLSKHHEETSGLWLVLAKKGTLTPTTLTHDQALEEAIAYGWIDGQIGKRDQATYRQRFTPRRSRSAWSRRNVAIAEQLIAEGRMRPAGLRELERASADGRRQAAYPGSKNIEVPPDLIQALARAPRAGATFSRLNRLNRYAILYRIATARKVDTRARRIDKYVAMLARGETIHPQKLNP
ncbi:MAG TPA: YdeI/OmpD-associated family protein [Candidatus Dormibacteraeota bacterium]|nr:YdeI/OmpD-associated family protein [Candidatus Dormibacteraeota bacterium]